MRHAVESRRDRALSHPSAYPCYGLSKTEPLAQTPMPGHFPRLRSQTSILPLTHTKRGIDLRPEIRTVNHIPMCAVRDNCRLNVDGSWKKTCAWYLYFSQKNGKLAGGPTRPPIYCTCDDVCISGLTLSLHERIPQPGGSITTSYLEPRKVAMKLLLMGVDAGRILDERTTVSSPQPDMVDEMVFPEVTPG